MAGLRLKKTNPKSSPARQLETILANARAVIDRVEEVMPEALEFGLTPIFDTSQKLVPVDTGALKRSAYLISERESGGAVASVGYAQNGSPTYAIRVHEILAFRHAAPTQAKFLETAANQKQGEILPRVAKTVRAGIGE